MAKEVSPVNDVACLRDVLSENILINAVFVYRVFESGQYFDCFANEDCTVALAVSKDGEDVLFTGEWRDYELPDALPSKGFFLSACPTAALDLIKQKFEIKDEWPCWHYLTPERYGPGPWDDLGPLTSDDVPDIAGYWELSDNPENHIRRKVAEFDSACLRVDGKPASWVGLHFEVDRVANMGFAHTLNEHRRKGYAIMVTKAIVNRLAKRGIRTTCHVIKENVNSVALCERLGFTRLGEATWADIGGPLD